MTHAHLAQALTESFNALADEVQSLIDRKTILEHKLRFAHEQYQYLADKYAPAALEVSETLAKLQLPPDSRHLHLVDSSSTVPLPRRGQLGSQHQIAVLIRDGRRAAQKLLVGIGDAGKEGGSSEATSFPPTSTMTSLTALEQDFTVEGKRGPLACPFSPARASTQPPSAVDGAMGSYDLTGTTADPTPHQSSDPICAAMAEEVTAVPAQAASQCPIRFLDKHSPEEVARYVETHKHEIPRSHEVCVRRYQKNEEQIKKLDAKYGSLVSMINDLGALHQPMLPSAAADEDIDRLSNRRVENWAQTVMASDPEQANEAPTDNDRESHFDRPLRDVRVGESPSRPWGISVPILAGFQAEGNDRPVSPPPAPVTMHLPLQTPLEPNGPKKCPFDHTKFPFPSPFPKMGDSSTREGFNHTAEPPFTPVKNRVPSMSPPQPTFVNPAEMAMPKPDKGATPQMVFNITGPVFIGYPMEQALEFMRHYQG